MRSLIGGAGTLVALGELRKILRAISSLGNRWRLDAYGVLTDEDLLVSGTVPSDRVSTGVVARPFYRRG